MSVLSAIDGTWITQAVTVLNCCSIITWDSDTEDKKPLSFRSRLKSYSSNLSTDINSNPLSLRKAIPTHSKFRAFIIAYHKKYGYLLLTKNADEKLFQLPGGYIDKIELRNVSLSEASLVAAKRQMFEKTGLEIETHRLKAINLGMKNRLYFELLLKDSDSLHLKPDSAAMNFSEAERLKQQLIEEEIKENMMVHNTSSRFCNIREPKKVEYDLSLIASQAAFRMKLNHSEYGAWQFESDIHVASELCQLEDAFGCVEKVQKSSTATALQLYAQRAKHEKKKTKTKGQRKMRMKAVVVHYAGNTDTTAKKERPGEGEHATADKHKHKHKRKHPRKHARTHKHKHKPRHKHKSKTGTAVDVDVDVEVEAEATHSGRKRRQRRNKHKLKQSANNDDNEPNETIIETNRNAKQRTRKRKRIRRHKHKQHQHKQKQSQSQIEAEAEAESESHSESHSESQSAASGVVVADAEMSTAMQSEQCDEKTECVSRYEYKEGEGDGDGGGQPQEVNQSNQSNQSNTNTNTNGHVSEDMGDSESDGGKGCAYVKRVDSDDSACSDGSAGAGAECADDAVIVTEPVHMVAAEGAEADDADDAGEEVAVGTADDAQTETTDGTPTSSSPEPNRTDD